MSPPATLAHDDLVAAIFGRPHHDFLPETALLDRGGELLEGVLVEDFPGLAWVAIDQVDRNSLEHGVFPWSEQVGPGFPGP